MRANEGSGGARRPPAGWVWLLAPVVIFVTLNFRSLDYEFVWTDQAEIEHGLIIRPTGRILHAFVEPMWPSLDKISAGAAQPYYRPLQVVLLSLVDLHMGPNPMNFRAFTLALGALTVLAFGVLVWLLIGEPRLAALAAAIVAAHPAGIENYVWIAGMANALCNLFIVCSLIAAAALLRDMPSEISLGRRSLLIGASSCAFVLSLLSKDGAIITPAITLALALSHPFRSSPEVRLASDQATHRSWIRVPRGPIALLIVIQIVITFVYVFVVRPWVLGGGVLSGAPPIAGSIRIHIATVLTTWLERFAWLFAPLTSTTSDVVVVNISILQPLFLTGVALLVAAPIVYFLLLRRGANLAAFGWAWMWIAFLPTSGLIPLTHVVATRYLSFSVFGAALLWLVMLPRLCERFDPPHRGRVTAALAVLLVFGLAYRTFERVPDWQSDRVLFSRDVERDPLFREGHYVLAVDRFEAGDFEEAKRHITDLQTASRAFGNRWSFFRKADTVLLLCRVNLELGLAEETLPLFGNDLRPDAPAIRSAPSLMLCAAKSLEQEGRRDEARRIRRAVAKIHGGS